MTERSTLTALPEPLGKPPVGHLSRWTFDSLGLLEEGAALGPVFGLQLWRKAIVGYGPDWNRFVLGDMAGFRSKGSLSQLSPYLSAGIVATDAPAHRARRAAMNPTFHRREVTARYAEVFAGLAERHRPTGDFDASTFSSDLIRRMLTAAFVGSRFPDTVMRSFLAPLDTPLPGPLLRRPIKVRRMQHHLKRILADPEPGTLAELFATLPDGVQEMRVAIAAAYDTTAHTLAFALWELAARPELNTPDRAAAVVDETLRMYPSGWIGSRVAAQDTEFAGHAIPAGRLVLYSPYLTHRSAELWPDPTSFRPERFDQPRPAWGYIPFSAGERTCLGAGLATLMLRSAVTAFAGSRLDRVTEEIHPKGVLTLTPNGPVLLRRTPD
ncbi:cytochrome P450 [Nakamurella flavida]|uniref:Cytochrome P450 n=1 Tax=Nakamurella flavida TaxID=363630 RepID=A0A938YFP5_9ACTN|nr:cytochrome P450 [Nakamurella flavida]MBM9476825.1 cytochrome P450 [Nakamurella flavida]MDP9778733.1 cytochrome P450 [Nakamurella flavida]